MGRKSYEDVEIWQKELTTFKFRDLQVACICRGMLFEDVANAGHGELAKFFKEHYEWTQDRKLLDDYDDWMDEILAKKYPPDHPIRSKYLRKGFIGSYDEDGNIKETKKPRLKGVPKEKRKKKEKDSSLGVFKGTKKHLTMECCKKGKTLEETTTLVLEKFPEAKEKSIRIWYNKSKKLLNK